MPKGNNKPGGGFSSVVMTPSERRAARGGMHPSVVVVTPSEQQGSISTDGSPTEDAPFSPDTDVTGQTAKEIKKMKKSAKRSSGKQSIKFIVKNTTGHPTEPLNDGVIEINTFDNKIFMYADGGWREMALW